MNSIVACRCLQVQFLSYAEIIGMRVTVRYPDDERVELDNISPSLSAGEFCDLIAELNPLLPKGQFCVSLGMQELIPDYPLAKCGVTNGAVIEVVMRHGEVINRSVCGALYEEYIEDTIPENGEEDVPILTHPFIKFKPNSRGGRIFVSALENVDSGFRTTLDDMSACLGDELAAALHHVKWTSRDFCCRAFLLELSPDVTEVSFKYRRYSSLDNNRGYEGGDAHSWQRYTSSLPVDATVVASNESYSLRIIPKQLLKPNTRYGVLLANNVPTLPPVLNGPMYSFDTPNICEDHMIFFTTSSESQDAPYDAQMVDGEGLTTD
jgi:hypothetical protein